MKKKQIIVYLKTMIRITFAQFLILILFNTISIAEPVSGQTVLEREISIPKTESINHILELISNKYNIEFYYSPTAIHADKKVIIPALENQPLAYFLKNSIEPLGISFEVYNNKILLYPSVKDEKNTEYIASQLRTIKGKIVDKSGVPLSGVGVTIKGTTSRSLSDAKGNYELAVPPGATTLVVSYIGFNIKEVSINNQAIINVTLEEDVKSLNEVVVIGYGTVNKSDLTGSVGQVKVDDLAKAPVISFTEALAGRVAGVQVTSNDGQPGSAQNIIIRGAGSLTQSNAPLYVIDGFPLEDFDGSALNSNDIASITVLKDASATAIYGARAANGVIVIETKKGIAGRPVVNFNTRIGTQTIRKKMDLMDAHEFVKYQHELNPAVANNYYLSNGKTLDSYKDIVGIDMQDHLFRTAPVQMYDLSLRGGNSTTKYSISGSINDHESVIINTGAKRHQVRLSLDQEINKKLKAGVIANYSNNKAFGLPAALSLGTNNPTNYLFANAWGYRPVSTNGDVDFLDDMVDEDIIGSNLIRINPVIAARNAYRVGDTEFLMANGYLTYDIVKNLTLKITASTSKKNGRSNRFNNSFTAEGSPKNPTNLRGINGGINYSLVNTWSNENTLTFNKTFAQYHKFNVLAGFSMQESKNDGYGLSVTFLPNEELGMPGFDEGTPATVAALESAWGLVSFFGRINYNYKSKYLATFTLRGDGSSKFAKGSQWGYFPSGAFAWNMKNEDFLKNSSFVSTSKIRLSYGITGNNRVSDFARLSRISFPLNNTVHFNNSPTGSKAAVLFALGNSDLRWESTELTDLGYDLGFFNNKVELTVDLYRKTTRDLLLNASMPYVTGYSSAFKNIGTVRNEGLEISLNSTILNSKTFNWETNFNISFNRSKVLALTENQSVLLSNTVFTSFYDNSPLWIAEIGQPVAAFHGYVFDGVYQYADFDNPSVGIYTLKSNVPTNGNVSGSIQPGDIRYKDLNGDGIINAYDQTVIGRAMPIHTGGFSNNFTYKGISLGIFFQWSYGNQIYNANRLLYEGNSNGSSHVNQFASYENRWTPDNPTNENFRTGGHGPFGFHSSRVLEDGSFLRLKTVQFGYQIPEAWTSLINVKKVNLTASAQNLFTITNYSGMDPEVSVRNSALTPGFDYSAYPHTRTLVFGVNVIF